MKKNILRFLAFSLAIHFFIFSGFSSYAMLDDLNNKKDPSVKEWLNDGFWNDDISFEENMYNYMKLALVLGGSTATAMKLTGGNPMVTPVVVSGLVSMELMAFIEKNTKDNKWGDVDFKEIVSNGVKIENDTVEFSDEVVDCIHNIYVQFLEESSGYVLIPTYTVEDLPVGLFTLKVAKDNLKQLVETIGEPFFLGGGSSFGDSSHHFIIYKGGYNYLPGQGSSNFETWYEAYLSNNLTQNGSYCKTSLSQIDEECKTWYWKYYCFEHSSFDCDTSQTHYQMFNLSNLSDYKPFNGQPYNGLRFTAPCHFYYSSGVSGLPSLFSVLVSADGCNVRVFKTKDDFRKFDLGKQPYYTSDVWNNYDYSADNSQKWDIGTLDKSVTDSHNTENYNEVVNNISNGMTEKEVSHLVETVLKNQNDKYNNPSSSDNGGGNSGSGSGSGLSDLLAGIGSLFDFFASLIGNIISMISNFLTTLIDSLGTFTSIFDGFSEFLSSAFGFIPKEAIAVIISGVTAIVVLAIIKFLKG